VRNVADDAFDQQIESRNAVAQPQFDRLRRGAETRLRFEGGAAERQAPAAELERAFDRGLQQAQIDRRLGGRFPIEADLIADRGVAIAQRVDEADESLAVAHHGRLQRIAGTAGECR
jgi:hypothetical protein